MSHDHFMAELLLDVPDRASRFFEHERRRIEQEFFAARKSVAQPKQKGYGARLQERFAKKRLEK